ncbi:MAG: CAP domain-containing protein, partial [Solirubrobacteraceae bacterium]
VAVAAGDRARAAQECADADLEPTPDNLARVRSAILCLHNQVRARDGLPAMRENARLRRAALGHSRAMVADGFFEHTTPRGVTMVDRIMRARYVRRDQGWALGENLAWGTGSLATARGAVQAWMDSPGHRANILKRSYRELGVGVVVGVPVSDAAGATYTVDFGVRR